jgi:hypothetical protein
MSILGERSGALLTKDEMHCEASRLCSMAMKAPSDGVASSSSAFALSRSVNVLVDEDLSICRLCVLLYCVVCLFCGWYF